MIQRGVGSLTVGEDGSSRFLGLCALMAFQGEVSFFSFVSEVERQSPASLSWIELTQQCRIQQGEDSEGAEEDSVSPEDPINVDGINPSFPFASSPTTLLTLRAALPPYQEGIRLADLYWKYAIALFCPIDVSALLDEPSWFSEAHHPTLHSVTSSTPTTSQQLTRIHLTAQNSLAFSLSSHSEFKSIETSLRSKRVNKLSVT